GRRCVWLPGVFGVTTGKLACTMPPFWLADPPGETLTDTNATLAGNVCEIDTVFAVLGPEFVTVKVKLNVCPTSTESADESTASDRSADSGAAPVTVTSNGIELGAKLESPL